MSTLNNILVIVDPTADTHPAVDKAIKLAVSCNARLDLFACETKDSREARYAAHLACGTSDGFIVDVRSILEPLAEAARDKGVDVCIDTAAGDALHTVLTDRAARTTADLIVKDTHHHSLVRRTFMTNTDWQLIRCSRVPLLLTKQRPWSEPPSIAAALDPVHVNDKPADLDHLILAQARSLAQGLRGSLHAIHAYLPMLPAEAAAVASPTMTALLTTQMLEDIRNDRQRTIDPLVRDFGIQAANVHLQMGVASEVLPRVASEIAVDILVMGAISRSGMQRLLVGSTAERVLEHLSCDVLIVRPPDFSDCLPF
jgi:universal stress protein E